MFILIKRIFTVCFIFLFVTNSKLFTQQSGQLKVLNEDVRIISDEFSKNIQLFNVDISHFPEINLILKISPNYVSRIKSKNLQVFQNGKQMQVLSFGKSSYKNKIPVDIVFVLDKTGSMIDYIDKVKDNINHFISNFLKKGIDYRIGIVAFSDIVDSVYGFSDNIDNLRNNINDIKPTAYGGDENENALEALYSASKLPFRSDAKKLIMLFTDALFHHRGLQGDGQTNFTLNEIIDILVNDNIVTYTIVPLIYDQYKHLSRTTGGKTYNLVDNFNSILDNFSEDISTFYTLKYLYKESYISDSIHIDFFDKSINKYLVSKKLSFLDVNKLLVLENDVLFDLNKSEIKPKHVKNLNNLTKLLKLRNNVEISINGHTDNIGSHDYNLRLSLQRANSVKKFLVKNGISERRLSVNGYGKTKPIAPNDSEEGRSLNRRIEVIITKK
jgi:outer membrane protein OmpA-like peptidoglycan-associated protein